VETIALFTANFYTATNIHWFLCHKGLVKDQVI